MFVFDLINTCLSVACMHPLGFNARVDIGGATIRSFEQKGKYLFEISTAQPGKKGMKKYVFRAEKEFDRDRWANFLRKQAAAPKHRPSKAGGKNGGVDGEGDESSEGMQGDDNGTDRSSRNSAESGNPMHHADGSDRGSDASVCTLSSNSGRGSDQTGASSAGIAMKDLGSLARQPANAMSDAIANLKEGYLMKKSPAMLKGWQKRYFKTNSDGDIAYYKSVSSITTS